MGKADWEVTGFVLMAGAGSRLKKMFPDLPKPLVPVGGVPLGIRVIRKMADSGINRIIVNLHHDAAMIREAISREAPKEMEIVWSLEDAVLGTGGGILAARPYYRGTGVLVVVTCDILTGYDLASGLRRHEDSQEKVSLVVSPEGPLPEAGRIGRTPEGGILFPERGTGTLPEGVSPVFFPGIHFLDPRIFDRPGEGHPGEGPLGDGWEAPFSIVDLYRQWIDAGGFIRADVTRSPWLDLGTEDGYRRHEAFLEELRQGDAIPGL